MRYRRNVGTAVAKYPLRMDINALNNVLFSAKSAGIGSKNPQGNAVGKNQPKNSELTTDNTFDSAYNDAVSNAENPDYDKPVTPETNEQNNTDDNQAETDTSVTDDSVVQNEQGQTETKAVNASNPAWKNQGDKATPTANALTRLTRILNDKLENLPDNANASEAVSRVIGKLENGIAGAVQQTVSASAGQAQTTAEAVSNSVQQPLNSAESIEQKIDDSIEVISQAKSEQTQSPVEDLLQTRPNQNQTAQQQVLGADLEPAAKSNPQQPQQNQDIDSKLATLVTEKNDTETSGKNGSEQETLNGNLAGEQTFGQVLQQSKSQVQVNVHSNEVSFADHPGQVLASDSANKTINQPDTNIENGNIDFQNKFGDAVTEKLQASIASSVKDGRNEITVNLNPPELGRVSIRLQQDNGEITGLLQFSKTETKSQMQQLLPQVVSNLQNSGIAVKRLDIIQTGVDNSNTYQQYRDNTAGDGTFSQQQFSQNQSSNPDISGSGYDWVTGKPSYTADGFYSDSYLDDEAMNVLV